ncbi:hypothetical protein BDR03DRAFT_984191 [Suillus americanus]|nr:hypothetical protein BDR03DRAFT_984191 [Suillus americanus]
MMLSDSELSVPSRHSLISMDSAVVEPQANSQGKGNASTSSHKEAAHWMVKEEAAFLNVLYQHKSGTDGMNFPKATYSKVSHGQMMGGACIDDSSASAWAGYVKSHPNAKQFQSKGFLHFVIFDLLAAGKAAKGVHVHRVWRKKTTSTSSGTTGLDLRELSVAANEISANMATSSTNRVGMMGPPTSTVPLSHSIPPTSPTAMAPPASPLPSTSPPSALTSASWDKHLATPTPIPVAPVLPAAPPSDFACTVEVLSLATNISDEDKLEMMPLFLKDKDEAVAFLYMSTQLRAAWVQKRLAEVRAMIIG